MKNTNFILIIILTIHITFSIKVQVEYDKERDIIIHNGKVYLPVNIDTEGSPYEPFVSEHVAELASGASFVFYVIATICK
jgi:hypothetical protein